MPERNDSAKPSLFNRVARVAFAFVVLNYSAVAGTVAAFARRRVWR